MKIERLRAEIERLQTENAKLALWKLAEVERLKAALKPFALNVNAVSLRDALGHISREDLLRARAALEPKS